ncbi:GLC3, partial [Symbiodinium sp. KB8]
LIRTITLVLGGEGYLAFAGNTFGHPEWLDFPREGNGWSFAHCRRQWSLVDDPLLRYSHLEAWDRALMHTCAEHPLLSAQTPSWISVKHEDDKVIVAERGLGATALVFAFNWHPTKSFPDYPVPVPAGGCWRVALSSDDPCMGGHGNAPSGTQHHALGSPLHERADHVKVYLPSRTVIVLQSVPAEA